MLISFRLTVMNTLNRRISFACIANGLRRMYRPRRFLANIREELLATTKLPLAVDFLAGELNLQGTVGEGMSRLDHYFHAVSGVRRAARRGHEFAV